MKANEEKNRAPKNVKNPDKPEVHTDNDNNLEEIWQKFELELKWCLDELEAQLSSKKLNQRQSEEATKVYKVLTNPKAHLVKKRQLMRTTFGDYREKMKQEEIKFKNGMKKISVSEVKPSNQKGIFLKRSGVQHNQVNDVREPKVQTAANGDASHTTSSLIKSDNSFKFDFEIADADALAH